MLALASLLERDPALTQRAPREGPKNGEPTTVKGGEAIQDTMNDMAVVFLEDILIRVFFIREEEEYFRRGNSQFPSTPSVSKIILGNKGEGK